ncbi:hypothetical protein HYX17_02605 [Candidatus Woesearchaeota archaeon]|nr:hypothetical protein [Candidatus Woesearchaeota archaeon]
MNKKVYEKLKDVARRGTTMTYTDLNNECNLNLDFDNIKDRNEIAHILGDISKEEYKNGRPLLSTVVVMKGSHPPSPAYGFFTLWEELGLRNKGESREIFFARELRKVFDYWKSK